MTQKILVADDSITIQKIVAMAFENEDARVEGVGNGKEAFDKMDEFQPDIVLADIEMPGLTGFELSKKIKESGKYPSTRVLLLASDFEDFNEDKYKESLADDHISKPFKSEDIVQKIKELSGSGTGSEEGVIELSESAMEDSGALELSADDMIEDSGAIELSADDMMEEAESDAVLSLSAEDLASEEEPDEAPIELSADSLEKEEEEPPPATPAEDNLDAMLDSMVHELAMEEDLSAHSPTLKEESNEVETPTEEKSDLESDVLDSMIEEMESLRGAPETGKEARTLPQESFQSTDDLAEVQPTSEESAEELDTAFKEIVSTEGPVTSPKPFPEHEGYRDTTQVEAIEPEPEDLLEKIAPSAFTRRRSGARPDLIKESLSYLSDLTGETKNKEALSSHQSERLEKFSASFDNEEDRFIQVVGEHVKRLLEKSLDSSLEKEIAGLSKTIVEAVREVVREVTPDIARKIIKEEIDKIRNM